MSVAVKMTDKDLARFQKCAEIQWPGAVLTKSSLILGLARLAANRILGEVKEREKNKEFPETRKKK